MTIHIGTCFRFYMQILYMVKLLTIDFILKCIWKKKPKHLPIECLQGTIIIYSVALASLWHWPQCEVQNLKLKEELEKFFRVHFLFLSVIAVIRFYQANQVSLWHQCSLKAFKTRKKILQTTGKVLTKKLRSFKQYLGSR